MIEVPTRPPPLVRLSAQPPTNRVGVDVLKNGKERIPGHNVAIVPTAFLPESKDSLVGPLPDGQAIDPRVVVFQQPVLHRISVRTLDRVEQRRHAGLTTVRKDQQVSVFGHKHEPYQVEAMPCHRPIDDAGEHDLRSVVPKEGEPPVTRKRQFVGMTGAVQVPHPLTVPGSIRKHPRVLKAPALAGKPPEPPSRPRKSIVLSLSYLWQLLYLRFHG